MIQLHTLMIRTTILFLLVVFLPGTGRADEAVATPKQLEFFENSVRPLLATHCYSCHSVKATKLQAGLSVDSRAALLQGGDSGTALLPGDAAASLLIEAVKYESYEMPPKGKLSAKEIQALERWVEMGAPWPQEEVPSASTSASTSAGASAGTSTAAFDLRTRALEHWVWRPIETPTVPKVADNDWPRHDLDHFVLARLENNGLHPSADTDRTALMRRLYFDLIGLPPTPDQAAAFLRDTSVQATERLVDKLLDSPRFGERWGRHWLDLVRYAESRGHEFDNDSPNAFQYRDYVIRALNADLPYDQFVREHIAGDLITDPRLNPQHGFNESVLGTGFWFLGEWVHSPVDIRKDEADRFDNMIDVMSKAFLGVTVACARCHDHKFDAISTADYYSLSGFLQSSNYRQVRFESLEHNRSVAKELANLDARYQQTIAKELDKCGVTLPVSTPIDEDVAGCVVVDYANLTPDQYMQDGFLFGSRPRLAGEASVTTVDGESAIEFATSAAASSDSFWDGLVSHTEKGIKDRSALASLPRSGRTLRTPTFTLTSGSVACLVRGTGHVVACVDSHRLIAGPLHGQTIKPIKAKDEWVQLNLSRYIGHRLHLEFSPAKNAHLEVSLVTQGASAKARKSLSRRATEIAESTRTFAVSARQCLAERSPQLARSWADERANLQTKVMAQSRLAMAMMDGTGEEGHVFIRGNSSKPGKLVPRHFLTAVAGDQPMEIPTGSGRLELARQINDPANPLTTRVIVNRIWHHLMGRGIVPTTDDFGVLGQRPTHPELLDHLATRFRTDGQSVKRMIRYIVLSRTYQMSGHSSPDAVAADAKNLLWHYRPPRRLEGEAIRDALLTLSGRLDEAAFGEPVPVYLTSFMDGRGRPAKSGPMDGEGRRSIYTAVRRNFISPFMLAFDTPVPFSTMGRRNVSNVPAQALILMNDPFVVEQSKRWAARAVKLESSTESRVSWMYQFAFARQPTDRELGSSVAFLSGQASDRGVELDDAELWSDFAHALINTKEFIFLR